jgi:prepilin-type N-terminal cleavage/methylation domain-containing protein/prepilin-type processing-associated H-X9-DG protein
MTRNPTTLTWATRRRFGVTLPEVLVVLAIIGILLGLTVPAILRVRDAAARAGCASNLRQLAMGVHLFADSQGQLPQGCAYPPPRPTPDFSREVGLSWHTSILPYVEQDALWSMAWQAQLEKPGGNSVLHAAVREKAIPVFLCPSEGRKTGGGWQGVVWGLTSYQGVAGTSVYRNDGIFHRNFTVRFADITDGTSNTLMIGERPPGPRGMFGAWYSDWGYTTCKLSTILPAGTVNSWDPGGCRIIPGPLRPGRLDDPCDVVHFWSLHLSGANFAFADGSVRFLPYSASKVLPALATRAGGEVVSADY